jgi:hypothetical protein
MLSVKYQLTKSGLVFAYSARRRKMMNMKKRLSWDGEIYWSEEDEMWCDVKTDIEVDWLPSLHCPHCACNEMSGGSLEYIYGWQEDLDSDYDYHEIYNCPQCNKIVYDRCVSSGLTTEIVSDREALQIIYDLEHNYKNNK